MYGSVDEPLFNNWYKKLKLQSMQSNLSMNAQSDLNETYTGDTPFSGIWALAHNPDTSFTCLLIDNPPMKP